MFFPEKYIARRGRKANPAMKTNDMERTMGPDELSGLGRKAAETLLSAGRRSGRASARSLREGLRALDEVAYIRFASVYRQFKDVESFMSELQQVLNLRKNQEPGV